MLDNPFVEDLVAPRGFALSIAALAIALFEVLHADFVHGLSILVFVVACYFYALLHRLVVTVEQVDAARTRR